MVTTGFSGNELYCLSKLGYGPGDILVGNSVYSLGMVGSLASGFRGLVGGEVGRVTEMIAEGRRLALSRLQAELEERGAVGASGVSNELIFHPGNVEFLSVASALHSRAEATGSRFTSSADGQELFCQVDAGYLPLKFVFGNVAYSIGLGRGILGSLRTLARGEVKEYTEIFNTTRNLALQRIQAEAQAAGANCVVGIRTSILPFQASGVQEMVMIGTASHNPALPAAAGGPMVVTSDLTGEELWAITSLGYAPCQLVLGTSVYSLGLLGGIKSAIRNLVKGEVKELTEMIYGAREESLKKVGAQASQIGADDVIGLKTYVYSLGGGLIEFLAIGTAIKYAGGQVRTTSESLPAQAIVRDKDTFYNLADLSFGADLNSGRTQTGSAVSSLGSVAKAAIDVLGS